MIKINLIEKKNAFKAPVLLGVDLAHIKWIPLIVGIMIYNFSGDMWLEYLKDIEENVNQEVIVEKNKLKDIKKELTKNKGVKDKLNAFNEKINTLKKRSLQVDKIIKVRTNPKLLLEEIARATPDGLWFNDLTILENREVLIVGASRDYKSIGDFILQINETPYFGQSIQLAKSSTVEEDVQGVKIRLESFELKGKIAIFDPYLGQ